MSVTNLKEVTCEACNKRPAVGVCSVPGVPFSCAYCRECLQSNNHPMFILIANTACCDGYENTADWWKEMVNSSLKQQDKTLEWFNNEVKASINSLNKLAERVDSHKV